MSPQQREIVDFLAGRDWTSPTVIGRALSDSVYGSPWASPKCKKLVDAGVLERNARGHYRLAGGVYRTPSPDLAMSTMCEHAMDEPVMTLEDGDWVVRWRAS